MAVHQHAAADGIKPGTVSPVFRPSAPAAHAGAAGAFFASPARGAHSPLPPLPCRSFRLRPKAGAGCQSRGRARRRKRFPLRLLHSMQPAPKASRIAAMGALPPAASETARQTALRRRSGWPAHRGQESFPPPARCTRTFCFAKPRLPPAGVCLPAASGHFASQNRRTPYFQKISAAVYVEPLSGEKAPLHGPGQGGPALFLICR